MVQEIEIRGIRTKIDSSTSLREISILINEDWMRPSKYCEGYLDAMGMMEITKTEHSKASANSIIRLFLKNSYLWNTTNARKIKSVLMEMIGGRL